MSGLARTLIAQKAQQIQKPAASGLLQRQCACGNHTVAGGECAACAQNRQGALQRSPSSLAINRPGDRYEQEADRVAEAVISGGVLPGRTLSSAPALRRDGPPSAPSPRDPSAEERRKYPGSSLPDLGFNEAKNDQHVQQPSEKLETNEDRFGAAGEKWAETFLETTLGKQLTDQAEKFGEGFVSTLPSLAVTLGIAASTVATMALRNEEFPLKGLVIKLPKIAPGLKVKLTYKGPLSAPTEAGITFVYEPEAAKKPQASDTDRTRAETERMAADQAKFQKGTKTPAARAAEQRQLDAIIRGRQAQSGNILGIPGLTPRRDYRMLQRDAAGSSDLSVAPPIVHDVLSSPGQPLDPATRSFMEPRFSHDFSGVRVHTDGRAAASAREVSANAYTVGPNIVFGAGQFAPGTHEGRRLIAHELTHVVQQIGAERVRGGQSNGNGGLSPINVLGSRGSEAVIQRDEVTESEEERRRKATFGDLPLISPEVAASWGMPSPPPSAVRKEISTSHTSPPGLGPKPGPRTPEDVIAASNVHPHGGHIKPTKKPVPLVPGWHKVVDENGVILGYLHLLVGVTRVLDADGKYVGGDELGLERPFIDPIDIFAGGIGGVVRGSLRGALSALARRAAPRIRVAGFLASQGLRSTVPVLAGDFAPSAFVMAETLAAESVPSAVRGVSGTAVRGAVSQGARAESASVIEATSTKGATAAASPGAVTAVPASSPGAQAVAGAAGATVASNVTAQQMDPRHARGYGGEQTMGFQHYSQKDGWEFIQGPSGSQGHFVTGSSFDGMAYNKKLDLLDLIDNKSLNRAGNVSSATAIDPAKNLAQNLDAEIARLTGMSDVPNRIRILELLRAKRAALATGAPGPSQVRLVVTHEGGQTTGVSAPLQSRGVQSR